MDKIIGMGNALVDVLVTLQGDALLDEMNLPKGSMQLIDEAKFLKIRNKFADVKTHKATGGSAGNTVLALANLGAQPGFIGKIGKDDFGQYFKKNGLKRGIDMNCWSVICLQELLLPLYLLMGSALLVLIWERRQL